jgi:peroxiredoxin
MESVLCEFEGLNSQVLAISCDPVAAKEAWGKSLGGISYPLVSDFWPHGKMCQAYGVFNQEFGRPDRSTFIVDKAGIIRWVKVYEPGEQPTNEEVLAALMEIERGAAQ